jgi:hypothetical protein
MVQILKKVGAEEMELVKSIFPIANNRLQAGNDV